MERHGGEGDTLATASARRVESLLQKGRGRSSHGSGFPIEQYQHARGLVAALPGARQQPEVGACGAPAKADRDEAEPEVAQDPSLPDDPKALESGASSSFEQEEGDEWEAIAHAGLPEQDTLDVTIDTPGLKGHGQGREDGRKRPLTAHEKRVRREEAYYNSLLNKDRAKMAEVLHRSNLLCALANGLLLDQAADDPLVQATALSVADLASLPLLHHATGVSSEGLQPAADWFSTMFRQLSPEEASKKGDEGQAGGLEAAVKRLQAVAAQREGTREELVALFVAVMRAHGLLARTVRALDVLPLKPSKRTPARAKSLNKKPARHKPASAKPANAPKAPKDSKKQRNSFDPGGAARAAEAAPKLQWRDQKQQEAADVDERSAESTHSEASTGGKGECKGKKRGGKAADRAQACRGGGSRGRGTGRGRKRGRGTRGRPDQDAGEREPDQALADNPQQAAAGVVENDAAVKAEAVLPQESGAHKKRRGDLEFENQLLMAMQASASGALGGDTLGQPPQQQLKQEGQAEQDMQRTMERTLTPMESRAGPTLAAAADVAIAANADANLGRSGEQQGLKHTPSGKVRGAAWVRAQKVELGGRAWAEVYCGTPEAGAWIHLDPILGTVDRAHHVERGTVRERPLAYVVAFSGCTAKDVTQRYVKSFQAVAKLRDEDWWQATMRGLRPHPGRQASAQAGQQATAAPSQPAPQGGGAGKAQQQHSAASARAAAAAEDLMAAREDAEFKQKASLELTDVPNTIPAFKAHPCFVLQRHIKRYSMLEPGTRMAGLHRGEPFYERSALRELHTADVWPRLGRQVRDTELGTPAKTVTRRGAGKEDALTKGSATPEEIAEAFQDDEEDQFRPKDRAEGGKKDEGITKLYGAWQTAEWVAPAAQDGRVPKNERGNVMCPPLAFSLPTGTVHLSDMPRITLTCKALGVDYAVAMTGFEVRGGQSVPKFDGVVVCAEYADAVVEAHWAAERERQEKADAKRRTAAEGHWRALLRSIFTRLQVRGAYADKERVAAGGPAIVAKEPSQAASPFGKAKGQHSLEEPIHLDSSCSEQAKEDDEDMQPLSEAPAQKSGAAAAAAVEAAKADVGRRETARKTWKDPVEAARQQAAAAAVQTPAAQGAGNSAQQLQEGDVAVEASKGQGGIQAEEAAHAGVGGKGRRRGGVKSKSKAATGGGQDRMQRKRTCSGVMVECEDI